MSFWYCILQNVNVECQHCLEVMNSDDYHDDLKSIKEFEGKLPSEKEIKEQKLGIRFVCQKTSRHIVEKCEKNYPCPWAYKENAVPIIPAGFERMYDHIDSLKCMNKKRSKKLNT